MLGQRPSCCRAVRRQLRSQGDAIWITDDILSKALQQFTLGSQSWRRNGSSVPGPLESRRRIGKRRMTQLSQFSPAPPAIFGDFWGFAGAPDRDQWQWEPPSVRSLPTLAPPPPPALDTTFLPDLLDKWLPQVMGRHADLKYSNANSPAFAEFEDSISSLVCQFQNQLKEATWHTLEGLCNTFALNIKESIILGVASDADLKSCVDMFTKEVPRAAKSRTDLDIQCLSLYRAIWEGLQSCSKFSPAKIGVQALKIFGRHLAHLESLVSVQDLALEIIHAVPSDQGRDIEASVAFIVQYWTGRIRKSRHFRLSTSPYSLHVDSHRQNRLIPDVQSVVSFLERLPLHLAHGVIRKNTDVLFQSLAHGVSAPNFTSSSVFERKRYLWLSTVANARCTNEDLLVDTWRKITRFSESMEEAFPGRSGMPYLTDQETCYILLDFLISQNKSTRKGLIRHTLTQSLRNRSIPLDSAVLLATFGRSFSGMTAISFIRVLAKVGRPEAIRDTIELLRRDGTKIRESRIVSMIRDIPDTQPRDAFELFKAHHFLSSGVHSPLKLAQFPALVVALIHHPGTHPNEIWGHLKKGLLTKFRRTPLRLSNSSKKLSEQNIALVNKMAEAFATAGHLSDAVAFRNVVRCGAFLRRHRAPITSKMSKALTVVGILRALYRRSWPGTAKSAWMLRVIEKGEGPEVAATVENMLSSWRTASCGRNRQ